MILVLVEAGKNIKNAMESKKIENITNPESHSKEEIKRKIQEAFNYFIYLGDIRQKTIGEIKRILKKFPFGTLEENINRQNNIDIKQLRKELQDYYPELLFKYNNLVARIKKDDLEHEEYRQIIDEANLLLEEFNAIK